MVTVGKMLILLATRDYELCYWTKHHPAAHHKMMRAEFLTAPQKVALLSKMVREKVSTDPRA